MSMLANQPFTTEPILPPTPTTPLDEKPIIITQAEQSPRRFLPKKWQKIGFAVLIVMLMMIAATSVVAVYAYTVVQQIKIQGGEAKLIAENTYTNFKNQNLPATEAELKNLDSKLSEIRGTYQKLAFLRFIPFVNLYYADGIHGLNAGEAGLDAGLKSLEAITPYADVLGFAGEGSFEGGTAEDRLKLVLETLEKVTPVLDEISTNLSTVDAEIAQINPSRYPENLGGTSIRPRIIQVKQLSEAAVTGMQQYRPIIEQLPEIMGANGDRKKYLILFNNDGELRPTGGFLTAYSIIYIEDGKVTPEKSDDIYELDKKIIKKEPIPEQLGRYLTTEKYFNLRDMNINPDFKLSMDQFYANYSKIKSEPQDIDGIISVNTNFLTGLLQILGPVEVPGYGTYSAEVQEDKYKGLPQVVYALSEIITRPTPYMREDRKGILGPMMRSILTKAYGAPKQQWPQLVEFGIKEMNQRDVQMYFFNENAQSAAEAINAAGRLPEPTANDFLAIVNANLGGAKSNFFIHYDVTQEVSAPVNGTVEKKVTIAYKNTAKGDNCNLEAGLLCLNATNRDWTRLYVPQGSELVNANGFTTDSQVYDEDGYTVIEGFFTLEPMGQAKIEITYKIPYTDSLVYKVDLWKQGGVDPFETLMDVTGGQEKVLVDKDTHYEVEF